MTIVNQESKISPVYLLDSSGELRDEVTPEFMTNLGLSFTKSPEFDPLTAHENQLLAFGDGVDLFNNIWGRFVCCSVIDGVKHLSFYDTDYLELENGVPSRDLPKKLKDTRKLFDLIACRTNGIVQEFSTSDDNYGISDYDIDVFIPISFFDWVNSTEEYLAFLRECDWSSDNHVKEMIEKYS